MIFLNTILGSFVYLLLITIFIRSFSNLKDLISNIKWVIDNNLLLKKIMSKNTGEKYIICIPMLREQRIVSETLKYFSNLNYPANMFRIVVVTTNKETYDKKSKSILLNKLAKDISLGKQLEKIRTKYFGLFPIDLLNKIYLDYRLKDTSIILINIKKIYRNIPTTFELATKEADIINSQFKQKIVTVINYPNRYGVMGHQINYVIKKLGTNNRYNNSIFAVYNADSRPNLDTLKFVTATLQEFEIKTGFKPNIVQQSSLFTLNYNKYPKTITGYILKSALLFQTKWTLVRELSRFRAQSFSSVHYKNSFVSKLFNTKISHCVGHGLFVRFGILKNEYLPTETINEDLPFGYYQCCKGEPILPLPILENSESPESISSLINQKRFWFSPYLEYLSCRRRVLQNKKYRSRIEVEVLTAQAEFTGVIWLLQSFILFAPLIISIYLQSNILIVVWTIGIVLYWFIPIAIIYVNLSKLEKIAGKSTSKISLLDYLLSSFAGLYIILTHSIGPILCIKDFVLAKLINKPIIKLKTER
ncbi:MAG: hypothetical protein ACD_19C00176G0050 [uncultured bacterium]|nr:MAG: hypothetical protein ACD_19C00176G0050 [uncultured bacterium]